LEGKVTKLLDYYSACDFCARDKTRFCDEHVEQALKQVYFMTLSRRKEDEMTRRCKYFKFHKGKSSKLLEMMAGENWNVELKF